MKTFPAVNSFRQGFKTDIPRDQLPAGAAYRMKDYIPQLHAQVRGRGGWQYATKDLNAVSAATSMSGVGWFPFAGDPHLITVSDGGKVFQTKVFDGAHGSYIDTTGFSGITANPFFHNNMMIILCPLGGSAAGPKKYYDTGGGVFGVDDLGGTPPEASVGASWGAYMILANGTVSAVEYPNRVWWSDPGDPETWGTGSSFWDLPDEVVHIVPLRNIILFYGYENTWALVGNTPPPGGNLEQNTLFSGNGAMDGRSVATYKEWVIWANSAGIWKTDGATLTDLTWRADIKHYWTELTGDFNFTNGWSACAEVIYGQYVISVHDDNGDEVVCLLFDLETETTFEMTNIPASQFARRSSGPGTADESGHEELFFAHKSSPRGCSMSSCWSPEAFGMEDADGTDVEPVLETAFYNMGVPFKKRIRRAYFTYGLTDGGDTPELEVSYVLSPEETAAYTATAETLPPTADTMIERPHPVYINREALGIAFKIEQSGKSTDTRISAIEIEGHSSAPEK